MRKVFLALVTGFVLGLVTYVSLPRAETEHRAQYASQHGKPRSPKWPAVERAFKAEYPLCEVCGSDKNVEIHHRVPFHVDPSKELDFGNLITLCSNSSCMSHLTLGHLGSYKQSNPHIREDSTLLNKRRRDAKDDR
jgi:hypothetical protein